MPTNDGEVKARLSEGVAEEIRVLLARRRMSERGLARQLGETPSWLNNRTTGRTPMSVDDLARIAETLGVGVVDLLPAHARHGTTCTCGATGGRPR